MYKNKRLAKHRTIRKKIKGIADKPRLSVYRSTQHIYAQLINDFTHQTLLSESDLKIDKGAKRAKAEIVGEQLAKKALAKKIKKIVFDRGGFRYQGRIAALAEGLRKGGLQF